MRVREAAECANLLRRPRPGKARGIPLASSVRMAKSAPPRQTSNKSGVKSTAKKMDNSRHGFGGQPAARKQDGAFGQEERITASRRQPGTAVSKPGRRRRSAG